MNYNYIHAYYYTLYGIFTRDSKILDPRSMVLITLKLLMWEKLSLLEFMCPIM